ncbi:kinase-like domain-containing protein [Penicillium antarcticum]|uniref:kinase-like domain-containing protein n=1 Tax=Penicillium antarcticum TaxID=416450 RepID=UPI00239C602A|nr:kinase-like domain-containing protein [Penicillium antarcticum]KAJ5297874.1 kinase-like domain-containing protein [Penicillium antarcticum]
MAASQKSFTGQSLTIVRQYAQTNFPLLRPTNKFEEERHLLYAPNRFSPVRIGEVFRSRYQVVGKLSFGMF